MKNASNVLMAEQAGAALRWNLPTILPGVAAPVQRRPQFLDDEEAAAYREGFAKGHAEGYAAGNREVREQAARVKNLLDHFSRPLQELDVEVERALVLLCVAAARQLVNVELALDPEKVTGAIHQAVAALSAQPRELRVHLHPQDTQLLRDHLSLNTEAAWKLVPDTTLMRGDCTITADGARVDARLDTRQASITRSLLDEDE